MMDAIDRLSARRQFPDALSAFAQQCILNLALSGEEGSVEIWVKLSPDVEPVDYVSTLIDRRDKINQEFDDMIVELGYPEGTGRII